MSEVKVLQQLIRIPSFSGHEWKLSEWIVMSLQKLDMKPVRKKWGVAVKIAGTDPQRAIIFNAHVDTVSPGNNENWKHRPFSGVVSGSRVYGLGASDNKASGAVLLILAKIWAREQPVVDIWLVFVREEETSGAGTAEFVKWWQKYQAQYKETAAIVTEPTGGKQVYCRHKGNIFAEIITKGNSGHGSRPDLIKTEAIEEMIKVKSWIKTELGGSLTTINAGNSQYPNQFPDECRAVFDIRTENSTHQKALQRLSRLKNCKFIYPPGLPGDTSPQEKIVKAAEILTGTKAGEFFGSADLCWFTQAGIPGIILGPGNPDCIHKPNEYCEISNLTKTTELFVELVKKYGVEYKYDT